MRGEESLIGDVGEERAGGDLVLHVAVVGFDGELDAGVHLFDDARDGIFGEAEDDRDGLKLGDDGESEDVVGVDHVSAIDLAELFKVFPELVLPEDQRVAMLHTRTGALIGADLANRYGALGLDRPHNLKVDGFYRFDLKEAGLVTLGASVRAQSGIPHNVLAADVAYGPGETYLLPRGVGDRSPTTGQADVHLAYGRRISKGTTLEVFGDVFNLTDSQQEATQDEIYTDDAAKPIVGGDMNDLKHVKMFDATSSLETAHTPTLNPNFGHTTAYLQSPRSFRFGVRLTF